MQTIEPSLQRDVPLAPRTSLQLGGRAEYFVSVGTTEGLVAALRWAAERGLEATILGGGTNVVIADAGLPGLVIHVGLKGVDIVVDQGEVTVRAAAGESWDGLVELAVSKGWAGVECLSGIPGSVGATPIQNVGAYGQEVSQSIAWVELLDRRSFEPHRLEGEACAFGYRSSRFKTVDRDRWVVTAVAFRWRIGGSPELGYPELERRVLSEAGASLAGVDLSTVRQAVLELRRAKGMVLDPADSDSRSAGSFFVNPILTPDQYQRLVQRCSEAPEVGPPPCFPSASGTKVPAAWLVERAGFPKGTVAGGVAISTKHALALVHRGHGNSTELLGLMESIQDAVAKRFGLALQPEPRLLGFDSR